MPELPEVETVKNGLNRILNEVHVTKVKVHQKQLRFKVPRLINSVISNSGRLLRVSRRAKYLIFEFENANLLNHLGMTGNWKLKPLTYKKEKHDHLEFILSSHQRLIYNDPRRFGWVELVNSIDSYFANKNHGPEPLARDFNWNLLKKSLSKKSTPIKTAIMDQSVVLGVGNIYACESLFKSRIHPNRPSKSVSDQELKCLVQEIKKVLRAAIKSGGSTIKDFKKAGGESGYFQTKLSVYGRDGQLCKECHYPISNIKLSGRSSFYCSNCQA